jgi:hypothetical protein
MKATRLLFLFSFFYTIAAAQKPYWQQQVNYTISVSLNDKEHSLDGHETMEYYNNSDDTLHFIWIHLWPNAYKNDRTAFTEQQLENGSTAFYFSDEEDKGYINRLAFKVNGSIAVKEDHPKHQDIVKLILPTPLAPKKSCTIETPFHVKLPYNFSRGGHVGQAYQITQWYPKAAVYDKKGWHEMPYLDQGEFYSDFGNYEVTITLPENYIVAATGELIKESTQPAPAEGILINTTPVIKEKKPFLVTKKEPAVVIPSSHTLKTITYKQNDVIDFAWFADKNFIVKKDTMALPSGRIINVAAYSLPAKENNNDWKNAVKYIKKAVLSRSNLIGEYPYNTVSAVQGDVSYSWGMEYPTITLIGLVKTERAMESVIEHEVGHNWLQAIIATNEREHPWMDEGMNDYYKSRYPYEPLVPAMKKKGETDFWKERMPADEKNFKLRILATEKKDQPIETSSEKFSEANYGSIAYYQTSLWVQWVETTIGKELFDSCMREYYKQWKFKHPYPEDFKAIFESVSKKNLGNDFSLLEMAKKGKEIIGHRTTLLGPYDGKVESSFERPTKLTSFFSFKETDKYKYIFASPAIGMNKLMIGVLLHNYTLPEEKFQFLIAPLYATGSKQLNGVGRIDYKIHQGDNGEKLVFSLAGASFNGDVFVDSTGKKNFLRFSKIVPGIIYVFASNNPRSHLTKYLQWKTFFITEVIPHFARDTVHDADIITYPSVNRYVNQLKFVMENNRVLYPYNATLQADQGKDFMRLAFTGNYFFNYAKGGGMNLRLFAGKFFYLGESNISKQIATDPYQLNMTGPKGYEDYTYSNYFAGRNEFDGFASQQIMQRDGFFKVRTDLLNSKVGKTDNWLAAANFTSDFPKAFNPLSVLPIKIPLKIFVDIGTNAEAWKKNSEQQKIIYDAGLQLSLFKNVLNIYAPILYSKVYKDYIQSTNRGFAKNISFSIDIQNLSLKKVFPQFAF